MIQRWLKERGSEPLSSFSPYERLPDGSIEVILGMVILSDAPPHNEPCDGEFWFEHDELQIRFYSDV